MNIKCHMHVLPALVVLATLNFQVVCSALIVNSYCFVLNYGEFLGCAANLAAAQPLNALKLFDYGKLKFRIKKANITLSIF